MYNSFEEAYRYNQNAIFVGVAQSGVGKSTLVSFLNSKGIRAFDLDAFGFGAYGKDDQEKISKGFYNNKYLLGGKIKRGDVLLGSSSNISKVAGWLTELKYQVLLFSFVPPTPEDLVVHLSKRLALNPQDWVGKAETSSYDPMQLPAYYGLTNLLKDGHWFGAFKLSSDAYYEMRSHAVTETKLTAEPACSQLFGNGFEKVMKKSEIKAKIVSYKELHDNFDFFRDDQIHYIDMSQNNAFNGFKLRYNLVILNHDGGKINNLVALKGLVQARIITHIAFLSSELYSLSASAFAWCLTENVTIYLPACKALLLYQHPCTFNPATSHVTHTVGDECLSGDDRWDVRAFEVKTRKRDEINLVTYVEGSGFSPLMCLSSIFTRISKSAESYRYYEAVREWREKF